MLRVCLLAVLMFVSMIGKAGNVNEQSARQKAEAFLTTQRVTRGAQTLSRVYLPLKTKSAIWSVNDAPIYAFNRDGGGYVIVSGDDRASEILGYSDKGRINPKRLPCNMKGWLQAYVDQIERIPANYHPKKTTRAAVLGRMDIDPMLKTAWGQDYPFNLHTPELHVVWGERDTTVNAATGCVATSMAQMMYYYQYPEATLQASESLSGIADVPVMVEETEEIDTLKVAWTSEAVPEGSKIDWANIVESYADKSANTDAQREAVARLMQYAGASVSMDYGMESGARTDSMVIGLADVFGYNDAYMMDAEDYEFQEWNDMAFNELAKCGPLLISGMTEDGAGHQFIIDGYQQKDGKDYFHTNWGWDGEDDGYYLLSSMVPESEWLGEGVGYSFGQLFVNGLGKNGKGKVLIPKTLYCDDFFFGDKEYTRTSKAEGFEVDVFGLDFYNANFRILYCDAGIGTYDENGNLLKVLYFFGEATDFEVYAGVSWYSEDEGGSLPFGADLGNGTYTVRPVCQLEGSDEWIPMSGLGNYPLTMTIDGNKMTFGNPPTAIQEVKKVPMKAADNHWHSLSGMRHDSKPSKKGIYIQNGKKIVVK